MKIVNVVRNYLPINKCDEGFVAIDHLSGGAVKIVDRMEFSKSNFSADVIKGWQR